MEGGGERETEKQGTTRGYHWVVVLVGGYGCVGSFCSLLTSVNNVLGFTQVV